MNAPSASRLDASPGGVTGRACRCRECHETFQASRDHAEFCSASCRKAWNNRRAMRGAEIYDLFMALRYDREQAKALQVWKLLCRLAAAFRDEDVQQREGRKSWNAASQILQRKTHLFADVVLRKR